MKIYVDSQKKEKGQNKRKDLSKKLKCKMYNKELVLEQKERME